MNHKLNLFTICLIPFLFLAGCDYPPVDMSKAQVTFKHTLILPAGFSIESSVPLDINKLTQEGKKNPPKIFEMEKFSIPIDIINDNNRHQDTKIKLEYSQNNIKYLYLYDESGQPLKSLGSGFYEFDKDVLPGVKTTLYVAGETKDIPNDYPYVGIDFTLIYLDSNNQSLAYNSYQIQVHNINYTVPVNISN